MKLMIFILSQLLHCFQKSKNLNYFSNIFFIRFEKNQLIIKREQNFNEIIFISEGEVELSFEINGTKYSRFFSHGFYFGDYNILAQKPNEFNYTAKSTCKCFCFPKTKFLKIINKHSKIKDLILDNSFQNYKAINLILV